MKFKNYKKTLQSEVYDIPDVLNNIKDNLPKIVYYPKQKRKSNYRLRYGMGFLLLIIFMLLIFSIPTPTTSDKASGPMQLDFYSEDEISKVVESFNHQKKSYIKNTKPIYENYTKDDIPINKIYQPDNQIALTYNNRIYYLHDAGLSVFNTLNKMEIEYNEIFSFDNTTYVKTMYMDADDLVVVYNNYDYINIIKYNINTMRKSFTYSIKSTYVDSYVFNGNIYLVSILSKNSHPFIMENGIAKQKDTRYIGYLENVIGESYTILTTVNLTTNKARETIFLSFDKWDIVYFYEENLYLVNTHMNYKKDLNYGDYTTIVKFSNPNDQGYVYYGSYSIKGSIYNENNVNAYKNNFRLILQVTHYNLEKSIFSTKVNEVKQSINIINLKESFSNGKPILELSDNYVLNADTINGDSSISVVSTYFSENKVVVESRSFDTSITVFDFSDPANIKTDIYQRNKTFYANITPLNEKFGFDITTIKKATGEIAIRFFNLESEIPIEIPEQFIYLDYSKYLDDGDFISLDAISSPNSLFLTDTEDSYYIGFNVKNNTNTSGTYTLITIDKITLSSSYCNLDNDSVLINKIVNIKDNIYGLADIEIVEYRLSSDAIF